MLTSSDNSRSQNDCPEVAYFWVVDRFQFSDGLSYWNKTGNNLTHWDGVAPGYMDRRVDLRFVDDTLPLTSVKFSFQEAPDCRE